MEAPFNPASVSQKHVRGFRWFTSLARVADTGDTGTELHQSLQLYSIYAQTGDDRYLDLCEDFLKLSLESNAADTASIAG